MAGLNHYLLAVILGIIEGLTEFLPVSSTAHLRIAEAILGINLSDAYWTMFTIVIQLGAILCLPIYFWKRILAFFSTFPKGTRGDKTFLTHPLSLTIIAFLVTSATTLPLTKLLGENLQNLVVMGWALVVGGIVMWVVDLRYGRIHKGATEAEAAAEVEKMSLPQAIWIGLCQTVAAIIPGTSRSMGTIAGGQVSGLSRTAALEFSFLISMPTMAAATGYALLKYLRPGHSPNAIAPPHIDSEGWILLAIGFIISFFVAWAVVAWFMHWVRNRGFTPFAIYRILAGATVLFWTLRAGQG